MAGIPDGDLRYAFLGKIKIPVIASWPQCSFVSYHDSKFSSPLELFEFIHGIKDIRKIDKLLTDGVVFHHHDHGSVATGTPVNHPSGSVTTGSVLRTLANPSEVSSLSVVLSLLSADAVMGHGFHYPPFRTCDSKDRSCLHADVSMTPGCIHDPSAFNLSHFNKPCVQNTSTVADAVYHVEDAVQNYQEFRCVFTIELDVWFKENALKHHFLTETAFSGAGCDTSFRIPLVDLFDALSVVSTGTGPLGEDTGGHTLVKAMKDPYSPLMRATRDFVRTRAHVSASNTTDGGTPARTVLDMIIPPPYSDPDAHMDDDIERNIRKLPFIPQAHQRNSIMRMIDFETRPLSDRFWYDLETQSATGRCKLKYCPLMNMIRKCNPRAEYPYGGGLLCDDTGLGKTLTVISTCALTCDKGPTLVVVPLSVLDHWKRELTKLNGTTFNVGGVSSDPARSDPTFRYYCYYGASRTRDATRMRDYTVILTTYTTLTHDYKGSNSPSPRVVENTGAQQPDPSTSVPHDPDHTESSAVVNAHQQSTDRASPLHQIDFHRIVLDEGHRVSRSAQVACANISARNRWSVTATPLGDGTSYINLYSQLSFVCRTPDRYYLSTSTRPPESVLSLGPRTWTTHIMNNGIVTGMTHHTTLDANGQQVRPVPPILLGILEHLVIRTSDVVASRLLTDGWIVPKIRYLTMRTPLDGARRVVYNNFKRETLKRIVNQARSGTAVTHTFNAFRRWLSLGGFSSDPTSLPTDEFAPPVLSPNERDGVVMPDDVCNICLETFENPCVLPCSHFMCLECVSNMMTRNTGMLAVSGICPMCRQSFNTRDIRLYDTIRVEDTGVSETGGAPPKVNTFTEYVRHFYERFTAENNNIIPKVVVFSEFKETHRILGQFIPLSLGDTRVFFLNGQMTQAQRTHVVTDFNNHTTPSILILSVRACSVGINLQAAASVVFMEPLLHKTDETQAIGRVKRMGQLSEYVEVVRIVSEGTIEELMVDNPHTWTPNVASIKELFVFSS
jgi:superfamily II DNA or RNA helicase